MREALWSSLALGKTGRLSGVASALVALVLSPTLAMAGNGVVALRTAAADCADDSGNIYVDCGNGTVTDNRTGLVWLKDVGCFAHHGTYTWYEAMEIVAGLSDLDEGWDSLCGGPADSCDCGLSDGSSPGDWRLPTIKEWLEMTADASDLGCTDPTITTDDGQHCWVASDLVCATLYDTTCSFEGILSLVYWAADTYAYDWVGTSGSPGTDAWTESLSGSYPFWDPKTSQLSFWPVRDGQ